MNNSQDTQNANSGCFSSILRRLLCSDGVPTHPSVSYHTVKGSTPAEFNQSGKINDAKMVNEAKLQNPTSNPGIVARLMGLDSLPADDSDLGLNGNFPDSVTRSRSVNFMDYLLKQQSGMAQNLPRHRRFKTSVSYREGQEKKSQQLFVLFLNDVDKTDKQGSKVRKSLKDNAELKNKKEERCKRKKATRNKALDDQECRKVTKQNVPRRISSKHSYCNGNKNLTTRKKKFDVKAESSLDATRSPLKTIEQKEVSAESKLMKKKKKSKLVKKTDQEGSSATSSADSVLDVNDFLLQYETELSEYSQSMDLDSMRFNPSLKCAETSDTDAKELQACKNGDYESRNGKKTEFYTELVDKLVKLTEEDITKLNWVSTRMPIRFEDLEEICVEVGQDVLNLLLQQLVDELGFYAMS